MSQVTDTVLKSYFQAGDQPKQSEFYDFIDSKPNWEDVVFLVTQHLPLFDIRAYGAVEGQDVTTNIQAAIADAHAVNGAVFIPNVATTWYVSKLFFYSYMMIFGNGYGSHLTSIDNVGGTASLVQRGHMFQPKDSELGSTVTDVLIRGLRLSGNSAGQNGGVAMTNGSSSRHGIALYGTQRVTVAEVWAEDFDGDGIYIGRDPAEPAAHGAYYNLIRRCFLRDNVRNGGMIANGKYNEWERNWFYHNQTGMKTTSPKYSPSMYQSACLDLEPNITGEEVSHNRVMRNWFIESYNVGVQITRPNPRYEVANEVEGNLFLNNAGTQLSVLSNESDYTIVRNNKFICSDSPKTVTKHLRMTEGDNFIVEGNVFIGGVLAGNRAIQIDDAGGSRPQNLVFRGNFLNFADSSGDAADAQIANCDVAMLQSNKLVGATISTSGVITGLQAPLEILSGWLADSAQSVTLGALPAYSYITAVRIQVIEAFNSDGTDFVTVGNTGITNAYATNTDVSTTGIKTPGVGAYLGFGDTATSVVAAYANGGTEPTTGKVLIQVEFYRVPNTIA